MSITPLQSEPPDSEPPDTQRPATVSITREGWERGRLNGEVEGEGAGVGLCEKKGTRLAFAPVHPVLKQDITPASC